MSPQRPGKPPAESVITSLGRVRASLGTQIRDARLTRRCTVATLAAKAGLSARTVYLVEAGASSSLEAAIRIGAALGLRLEIDFVDPRRKRAPSDRLADPVHSAMGEFEVGHFRPLGVHVGVDEPYQHYQFAGRADLVAWDEPGGSLLHIENRTRFPDIQDMAGTFNAKKAYLGTILAERLGASSWKAETHVVAGLWSAEVLHVLRTRRETFRALCPDPPEGFASWWSGSPPSRGVSAELILLDPLASGRQREFISLEAALNGAHPRHRGYADVASKLLAAS